MHYIHADRTLIYPIANSSVAQLHLCPHQYILCRCTCSQYTWVHLRKGKRVMFLECVISPMVPTYTGQSPSEEWKKGRKVPWLLTHLLSTWQARFCDRWPTVALSAWRNTSQAERESTWHWWRRNKGRQGRGIFQHHRPHALELLFSSCHRRQSVHPSRDTICIREQFGGRTGRELGVPKSRDWRNWEIVSDDSGWVLLSVSHVSSFTTVGK